MAHLDTATRATTTASAEWARNPRVKWISKLFPSFKGMVKVTKNTATNDQEPTEIPMKHPAFSGYYSQIVK